MRIVKSFWDWKNFWDSTEGLSMQKKGRTVVTLSILTFGSGF